MYFLVGMKVKLTGYTPDPEKHIASAARVCYLSEAKTPDADEKLIAHLINMGHESVLEHSCATFDVSGVSRALTHQLVRHRIASFSQQSQRYVDELGFEYVTPPSLEGEAREVFMEAMEGAREKYERLRNLGVPKEDARFVLPNACETRITVTMNFRELRHFIKLRSHKSAQWEIRELAQKMLDRLIVIAPKVFEDLRV
ncbi:MAG: FAD-dependent thymidylate synthase [Candidatus Altiarchaeales archaeon]|nr:FAD-dependent thymidylate synthase [Candidatus Altiarchaeales archaeon]